MPDRHRYSLPVPPEHVETAAALLWAAGAEGIWERPGELVAWFAAPVPLPAEVADGHFVQEPDRDWQAEWKATITPVHAGRFAVVPTWLADQHVPAPDETTIVLDPGRAFGSGHHATTAMCLELLDDLPLERAGVIDVGCGSGVLAIAAALRGATVVGSDVDPEAVAVCLENATRNAVRVAAVPGSVAQALAQLGRPADIALANLVTDTVVTLAADLVAAVAPDGVLIVSGIATERYDRARDAFDAAGLAVTEVRERDGWSAIVGHRADRPGCEVARPVEGR